MIRLVPSAQKQQQQHKTNVIWTDWQSLNSYSNKIRISRLDRTYSVVGCDEQHVFPTLHNKMSGFLCFIVLLHLIEALFQFEIVHADSTIERDTKLSAVIQFVCVNFS